MVQVQRQHAIGAFPDRASVQRALTALRNADFPMDKITVLTKDNNAGDRISGAKVQSKAHQDEAGDAAKTGAVTGGVGGGILGLLEGLGIAAALPGIGPVIVLGSVAGTAIATAVAGGALGAAAGGLLGALIGWGVPEQSASAYNDRLERGEYLVLVEGSQADVVHAESLLHSHGVQEWGVYDAPVHEDRLHQVGLETTDRPML